MRADELIQILKELPADAEVVIAVVEPVDNDADEISLKRYDLDVLLPEAEDGEAWLVVGEEADLDAFLDAIDGDDEGEDEGEHRHEHGDGHDHDHEGDEA
jgi:uncharacterized Zn finger protein